MLRRTFWPSVKTIESIQHVVRVCFQPTPNGTGQSGSGCCVPSTSSQTLSWNELAPPIRPPSCVVQQVCTPFPATNRLGDKTDDTAAEPPLNRTWSLWKCSQRRHAALRTLTVCHPPHYQFPQLQQQVVGKFLFIEHSKSGKISIRQSLQHSIILVLITR
jgi:hypothetical protein